MQRIQQKIDKNNNLSQIETNFDKYLQISLFFSLNQ